jgi:uncharacterized protein (DUF58 family)
LAPLSWWPFLWLIFLLGLLTRVYSLAAFALMLLIISGIALWWKNHALDGVSYQRRFFYRRGYPDESIDMQVEVENRKFLPVPWLRIRDRVPNVVGPVDEALLSPTHMPDIGSLTSLFSLRWYERDRRTYSLLLRKRGVYRLGPAQVESGDIFGIFEQSEERGPTDFLTVFPESIPFKSLPLPSDDPLGDRQSHRRLYEDPNQPMGVRDYRPEDDFRRIHWPVTAHTGSLQVKVYQPISARVLVVCLNVMTLPYYWEGTDPEMLEYLVKISATIVERTMKDGYRVGMVSNSSLAHADQPFRVPPGRSPNQLVTLLTALASVTPFVTGTFDRFLIAEVPRLPYGATLLVLTAIVNDEIIEALLRLKQHGRRIIFLSVDRERPPQISGITIYHMPYRKQ